MRHDRLSHLALLCIKSAYVNSVDIQKMIDEYAWKDVVLSSFSNRVLDQNTLVIHFMPGKKSELVNSLLVKVNRSLSY